MLAHFLAHKIVNFVLLTDSFTVSFFNIIENLILNENTANTKQPSGRGPGKVIGTFEKRASGQQSNFACDEPTAYG